MTVCTIRVRSSLRRDGQTRSDKRDTDGPVAAGGGRYGTVVTTSVVTATTATQITIGVIIVFSIFSVIVVVVFVSVVCTTVPCVGHRDGRDLDGDDGGAGGALHVLGDVIRAAACTGHEDDGRAGSRVDR